jgi:hypothetical protein
VLVFTLTWTTTPPGALIGCQFVGAFDVNGAVLDECYVVRVGERDVAEFFEYAALRGARALGDESVDGFGDVSATKDLASVNVQVFARPTVSAKSARFLHAARHSAARRTRQPERAR